MTSCLDDVMTEISSARERRAVVSSEAMPAAEASDRQQSRRLDRRQKMGVDIVLPIHYHNQRAQRFLYKLTTHKSAHFIQCTPVSFKFLSCRGRKHCEPRSVRSINQRHGISWQQLCQMASIPFGVDGRDSMLPLCYSNRQVIMGHP